MPNEDKDPTAIAIQYDPQRHRMIGQANHSYQYFDMDMITRINDTLWIGGHSTQFHLPASIRHVVSLYRWGARYKSESTLKSYLEVEMYDDVNGFNVEQVIALANWINVCQQDGETLVHCQAGLNRSSLVAATSLLLKGEKAKDIIKDFREKRSEVVLCNPTFEEWLLDYGN